MRLNSARFGFGLSLEWLEFFLEFYLSLGKDTLSKTVDCLWSFFVRCVIKGLALVIVWAHCKSSLSLSSISRSKLSKRLRERCAAQCSRRRMGRHSRLKKTQLCVDVSHASNWTSFILSQRTRNGSKPFRRRESYCGKKQFTGFSVVE